MIKLALRNVFRNRTRSVVIIATIAFSTTVLVVAAGFVDWIFATMREWAVKTGTGHVQLMRAGYLTKGASDPFSFLVPPDPAEIERIKRVPHVVAVGQRLNVGGLVSFGDATLSFLGSGVEPAAEEIVTRNLRFDGGTNLEASSVDEVVVGMGLATSLGVKVGDRVVLTSTTARGSVNAVEATVRGIFTSQIKALDDVTIRMPLATAQRLIRVKGSHLWIVSLDDTDATSEVAAALKALARATPVDVFEWTELSDFYTKTVTFLSGQLGVMRILIGFIVVLGVSNMLIMNVLERTGEIGTLLALGQRRATVTRIFLVESVFLGLIGSIVGLGSALVAAKAISLVGVPMPPPPGWTEGYSGEILVTARGLSIAFGVTCLTTIAAGIYPAKKASRMNVVDALRQNR